MLGRLAPLPQLDGLYLMQEGMADTYATWNWEHPALLGAYGMQPGDGVDPETMRRSLRKIMEVWQWDRCWGWDFPMAALTAARLGGIGAGRPGPADRLAEEPLPAQRPRLPAPGPDRV